MSGYDGSFISPQFSPGGRWLHFWWARWSNTGTGWSVGVENVLLRFQKVIAGTPSPTFTIQIAWHSLVCINGSPGNGFCYVNWHVPHWFAIYLDASADGRVEMWIDGEFKWSWDGNTQGAAEAGWDMFSFEGNQGKICDDFIVTDSERLDEHVIISLVPNSDSVQGLTPASGVDHYPMVNENPPTNASEYNEATALNQYDTYGLTDISWTPASIAAVDITVAAYRSGFITGGQVIADPAGLEHRDLFLDLSAADDWATPHYLLALNPDAGGIGVPGPWTTADVNNLKVGFEFA
jgi:hypothetical protein